MRVHAYRNEVGVLNTKFICVVCNNELAEMGVTFVCQECGRTWPIVDGVPHFVDRDLYWGEISQGEMQKINKELRTRHWREVLTNSPVKEVQTASTMIRNIDRANWHLLLSLSRDSTILDVGAGMGTISHALAMHYRQIIALEPVLERIEFMRYRFQQENLKNVQIVRASALNIPLPQESVDLVILNGVLEWVPLSDPSSPPQTVQEKLLENILTLLKPGGFLYIGIENRLTPSYFLGANDPHADIPYVAVLPRFLANWYSRRKTGSDYRTYIYSYWGYRKLLKKAGFDDIQIWSVIPTYNNPKFIVPFDRTVYQYFLDSFCEPPSRKRAIPYNILRVAGFLPYLGYSFIVFGRKE